MTDKQTQTTSRWECPETWKAWKALFIIEHDRHERPFGDDCDPEDFKEFFEDGKGPHEAIEEAFNDGCN